MTSRNYGFDLTADGVEGPLGRLREGAGDSLSCIEGSVTGLVEQKAVVLRVPGEAWL